MQWQGASKEAAFSPYCSTPSLAGQEGRRNAAFRHEPLLCERKRGKQQSFGWFLQRWGIRRRLGAVGQAPSRRLPFQLASFDSLKNGDLNNGINRVHVKVFILSSVVYILLWWNKGIYLLQEWKALYPSWLYATCCSVAFQYDDVGCCHYNVFVHCPFLYVSLSSWKMKWLKHQWEFVQMVLHASQLDLPGSFF